MNMSESHSASQATLANITTLEQPIERALFGGQIKGLLVTFYQNERPPYGLLGKLDWHFHGMISKTIRVGAITGRVGEYSYVPLKRKNSTYHLILIGAGASPQPGLRPPLSSETLEGVRKNLLSLKLEKFGISRADFGNISPETLSRQLKGISLWIAP